MSQKFTEQLEIAKIVFSFFSHEYLNLFISLGLKDLYNFLKEVLKKFLVNFPNFNKYTHKEYKILMKHILVLDFDYKKIFESERLCCPEDKPLCKLIFNIIIINIIIIIYILFYLF